MATTKKMNQLPELTQLDNSQSLLVTDGSGSGYRLPATVLRAEMAAVAPITENEYAYGIEFDTTVASPACTRVGNLALHVSLPIQSRMRGCLLNDDGTVVEYLDPNDWTAADRSGARGMVMVEVPDHYERFITDGTKRRVMLSEYPLPGYMFVPKFYISAYEATVDRTVASTPKLASVVNYTAAFRGGAGTESDWDYDGTELGYRTLLGRPATNLGRGTFRTYARNRKSGSTQWNLMTYDAYKTVVWLYFVEYANFNSQLAYNGTPTAQGYRQGGLGNGVTTLNSDKRGSFNSYKPVVPCGISDSLGNGTGTASYTMPAQYDSSTPAVSVPRYRGIENIFGHINKTCDGILILNSADVANGGDGTSKVYICSDPAKFSDSSVTNYRFAGLESRSTYDYIKEIIFGEYGDIIATAVGGASTTYFCDYIYSVISTSGTAARGVWFGGRADYGALAGLVHARSNYAPSVSDAIYGSRLCYIPATS